MAGVCVACNIAQREATRQKAQPQKSRKLLK
jgi:hypothetical protein